MMYIRITFALLLLFCVPARAQWQVDVNKIPLGRGTGTGFKGLDYGTSGQCLVSQGAGLAPTFAACSASVPVHSVTNDKLAQVGAATIKGNPDGATADVADFTIQGLTARGAPDGANDKLLIFDVASGTFKYVTPDQIAAGGVAGVTSFNARVGTVLPASGDYDAGQVAYTPSGAGAAATTVKAQLDRIIWANDYGAVCNGTTDDSAAFQNAINQGMATGAPVRFNGVCAINSTLNITSSVDFGGFNATNYTGIASRLVSTNMSITMILVNTPGGNPVYLHDFGMSYAGTSNPYTTAAITVTSPSSENAGSKFERLTINGGVSVGLNFIRASAWVVNNNTIVGLERGIIVGNLNNSDSGDSTIVDNHIQTNQAGIYYIDSSGLRIINNKINGGGGITYGIVLALRSGSLLADLFITGNSIEGISNTGGYGIYLVRSGTTGGLGVLNVANNELSGQYCMAVPPDSVNAVWLNTIAVTGNTCIMGGSGAAVGFYLDGMQGATIMSNSIQGGSSGSNQAYVIGPHGPNATNCVIGATSRIGAFAASGAGGCSTVAPF